MIELKGVKGLPFLLNMNRLLVHVGSGFHKHLSQRRMGVDGVMNLINGQLGVHR